MSKTKNASSAGVPLKMKGQSIYLAGNFFHKDELVKHLIKLEGGKIVDELTDKTDLMVLGYSGIANPQKKAAKLNAQGAGIQSFAIDQFCQNLRPTPDEAVELLKDGPAGIERWNQHHGEFRYRPAYRHSATNKPFLQHVDFSNADLSGAWFSEPVDSCDFTGANLKGCILNLVNCQLGRVKIDGVQEIALTGCNAENVDFTKIAAHEVHIEKSNLQGCRFGAGNHRRWEFMNCELDNADFSGMKEPQQLFFKSCSLKNAKFANSNLEQADFSKSDLTGVDFKNANLKLALLTGATVDGADFTGAIMVGADVDGVDFSKAVGYDPAQTQTAGGPGAAVKEYLQTAAKANRITTTLTLVHNGTEVTLTLDAWSNWVNGRDTAGNYYHHAGKQNQSAFAQLWANMATKWHGATPDFTSVKVRAVKAAGTNKELKDLAMRAWCELFGVAPLTAEDLKKAAASNKASKKERADEGIALLQGGKKGVEEWNRDSQNRSKLMDNVTGIELPGAKLGGLTLQGVQWKGANLSGADFAKSLLLGCKFPEANLAGANLKNSQLRNTSFNDANLENADASSSDLNAASFKRANCKGLKLTKAELKGADFCGADLTGADLANADLTGASYDEKTVWPKGYTPTLEMTWKGPGTSPAAHKLVQSTKPKGKLDIEQFMKRLGEMTDAAKLDKALKMLKADRFRLYAQVNADHFVGVVKSQTSADLVYSCRLNQDGTYACCTQNLNICGGLRGSLCKHLLVLIVGLAKNGDLDPNQIDTWIRLSKTNKPALDKDAMSETFLRYKGAEAGEVDWRPTETIPEDYYAM